MTQTTSFCYLISQLPYIEQMWWSIAIFLLPNFEQLTWNFKFYEVICETDILDLTMIEQFLNQKLVLLEYNSIMTRENIW